MFCPECGTEDRNVNQFCRACGADLKRVRGAFAAPDDITASAASAREEIGRALAAKIRESRSADELSVVAEEVLPEFEKFLESPQERRMRRMRTGTILSCIGAGTAIGISLVGLLTSDDDVMMLAALGVVCFFIGVAFVLNGIFLTIPKELVADKARQGEAQKDLDGLTANTSDLHLPDAPASAPFVSVTENTTKHLKEPQTPGS